MPRKMLELCCWCKRDHHRSNHDQHGPCSYHCHWVNDHCINGNKTWSPFKKHFNKAFKKLQELNKITAWHQIWGQCNGVCTNHHWRDIWCLDNLANATVQKTDTVNKLGAALWMTTNKTSWLNKIIESSWWTISIETNPQRIGTLNGIDGPMGTRLNGITLAKHAKTNVRGTGMMPPGTIFGWINLE